MKAMVEPAAAVHGLTVVRADEMSEPGTITAQIVEHVVGAKAVVADLTDENANVFYELAVRDAAHLPAVMIAEVGTNLPFDKAQDRTIFFEAGDLASVWEAKDQLATFLGAAFAGKMGNPIANAMVWKEYAASGKPVEEVIAQLAEQLSQVAADVHSLKRRDDFERSVRSSFPSEIDRYLTLQDHGAPGSADYPWALRAKAPEDGTGGDDSTIRSSDGDDPTAE